MGAARRSLVCLALLLGVAGSIAVDGIGTAAFLGANVGDNTKEIWTMRADGATSR